jgi:cell division protein ZapA
MLQLPRALVACYGPDMPPRRAVELRVGGQTYRVVATEDDRHVQHLAELVDRKHQDVVPQGGRGVTAQQAMFLTALALAEELEEQRARAAKLEAERDRATRLAGRAKEAVSRLLSRVDAALSPVPQGAGAEGGRNNFPVALSRTEGGVWGEGKSGPTPEPPEADALVELGASGRGERALHPDPLVELGASGRGERALHPDPLMDPPDAIHEPVMFELLAPKPRESGGEAGVPRGPRGGLRLVRRTSSPDDDSR